MFNLLARARDAYCYFNRHYLILKFSECRCVLEGGCDCLAPRYRGRLSRTLLFPSPILSPIFYRQFAAPCPPELVNLSHGATRSESPKIATFFRTCARMPRDYRVGEKIRYAEEELFFPCLSILKFPHHYRVKRKKRMSQKSTNLCAICNGNKIFELISLEYFSVTRDTCVSYALRKEYRSNRSFL